MTKSRAPSDIFPERLRQARELRHLSQAELAARAELQPSAVSHFETGTRRPSFDNLRRLADTLQVSTDYLIGRSENIGGAPTGDVLYRNIERLSASDRDFAAEMISKLASRNRRGDGDGS